MPVPGTIDTTGPYENVCPGDLKLILMHGLPRSGKSTWARAQGFPIVCKDAIRFSLTGKRWWAPIEPVVHATAWTMVRSLFWAGHETVIVDFTSNTMKMRDQWIAEPDVPWKRYYKAVHTPESVCIERAEATYPSLVPVIKFMANHMQPVSFLEDIEPWTS